MWAWAAVVRLARAVRGGGRRLDLLGLAGTGPGLSDGGAALNSLPAGDSAAEPEIIETLQGAQTSPPPPASGVEGGWRREGWVLLFGPLLPPTARMSAGAPPAAFEEEGVELGASDRGSDRGIVAGPCRVILYAAARRGKDLA